jgi:hypothetical protein
LSSSHEAAHLIDKKSNFSPTMYLSSCGPNSNMSLKLGHLFTISFSNGNLIFDDDNDNNDEHDVMIDDLLIMMIILMLIPQ